MEDLLKDSLKKYERFFPQKAWQEDYLAAESNTKVKYATFQGSMKVPLIIGQCFGLNPVLGITEIDTLKLRFTLFSWRCIYTILAIIGQSIFVFFCFLKLIRETDASLPTNTSTVFYSSNCLTTILFFRLARQWPRLSQQIARLEASDPNTDSSLPRKCNVACFTILFLALMEHILSIISEVSGIVDCPTGHGLYESFITKSFPWVFAFVPYNDLVGVLSQIVNIQCTFNWNFADVFVICVSYYLTARLDQVNKRIFQARGKHVSSSFWRSIREDYCKATSLVRKVDDVIGGIIFLSFANNLFFICLQLLHALSEGVQAKASCQSLDDKPFKGYEQAAYFVYSFIFLVVRAMAVLLVAARVHTASKLPAQALYRVSSSDYYVEVQRFIDQIHSDTVALSGIQFFNIKRGLVLTIAGTIVTYELVLIQFTSPST